MINLAFWQLRRLDERRQFNAEVRANANQPIAALDDVGVSTEHAVGDRVETGARHRDVRPRT